jgi:hypothetical protein
MQIKWELHNLHHEDDLQREEDPQSMEENKENLDPSLDQNLEASLDPSLDLESNNKIIKSYLMLFSEKSLMKFLV